MLQNHARSNFQQTNRPLHDDNLFNSLRKRIRLNYIRIVHCRCSRPAAKLNRPAAADVTPLSKLITFLSDKFRRFIVWKNWNKEIQSRARGIIIEKNLKFMFGEFNNFGGVEYLEGSGSEYLSLMN